jgi:hypothetical protein
MCGSTEINGYTFCSGLSKLELSYKDHPGLQSLIRPMIYLNKGAIFRPKYATFPLSGLSLGELIDMYYTREATIRHDKVYALLSMSSDGLDKVSLLPDYMVPWNPLLQRLVESILSTEVSIDTWDKREIAVIKGKGYILGHVSAVSMVLNMRDSMWNLSSTMHLDPRNTGGNTVIDGLSRPQQSLDPRRHLLSTRGFKTNYHQTMQGSFCYYYDCSYSLAARKNGERI